MSNPDGDDPSLAVGYVNQNGDHIYAADFDFWHPPGKPEEIQLWYRPDTFGPNGPEEFTAEEEARAL